MRDDKVQAFIKDVLEHIPNDWLSLTTHRLDIYDESQAKSQFLEQFESLFHNGQTDTAALAALPTAYDYIRLGHPLSSVLEWAIAQSLELDAANVISFASKTIPVIAILRENLLANKNTQITYTGDLPIHLDVDVLRGVYGFNFELKKVEGLADIPDFKGSTVFISEPDNICDFSPSPELDFLINVHADWGSVILINKAENEAYVPKIQHVRRRETIAMTPANAFFALKKLVAPSSVQDQAQNTAAHKALVLKTIQEITGTTSDALVASSGLSMQFAITMGLIHEALDKHPGKPIKIIVPTNCYGGTNDQARRVAAFLDNVEVVDLLVDGGYDMVQSLTLILDRLAQEDAVPYIIAEIPTNPRVEVPDLQKLEAALSKSRQTAKGANAIEPVFILDQTFCPNTPFLGENDVLAKVKVLSYVSGSKFPSGGRATAGYCVANKPAESLMDKIALHLAICDNEATPLQYEILATQMPSMLDRIERAYQNTRDFVNFIQETLPEAKINFVSEELAEQGFTPSVFSLDLPTKGETHEIREAHKRSLNLKLINMMIGQIPQESKYCVSYGQLKGCYWTIPATSTQGTTKEADKDYIARVSVSPDLDLEMHKKVFKEFVEQI